MKALKLTLSEDFELKLTKYNALFELENNSSKIEIEAVVDDSLTYELHIQNGMQKNVYFLDKTEAGLEISLTDGMLNRSGRLGIQLRAFRGEGESYYAIESNRIDFIVKDFINASGSMPVNTLNAFERVLLQVEAINTFDVVPTTDGADIKWKGETVHIANGRDGVDGNDGAPGRDGFSPIATVERTTTGAKIKITDKSGTTEAEVHDGKDAGEIPTKVSQLENDAGYVTQQKLDEKMQFYKLDYEDGKLKHEGVVLTYAQIVEKFNDNKYFEYATDGSFVFIPSLPPLPGDEIIEFSSSYIYGGKNYMARIIINSNEEVKWEEIEVARATALDDLPKDVQINGTSILNEGVANIPLGNTEQLGVVKTNTALGIGTRTNTSPESMYGTLQISPAQEYAISNRNGTYLPICADSKLDLAVKYAMCDGKGAEWTDAEKQNAQKRIGLGGEWKLLDTITLTEDTASITRKASADGTPFNYDEMMVLGNVKANATSDQLYYKSNILNVVVANGLYTAERPSQAYFTHNGLVNIGYGNSGTAQGTFMMTRILRKYTSITITPFTSGRLIPSGSTFSFYGR